MCARAVIRSVLRGHLDSACAPAIPAIHTADHPLRLADAALSGTVHWDPAAGTLGGVAFRWSQSAPEATAVVRGATLRLPAP